jgi:diguanylate cyclase (GGDEF)-like protein
MTPPVKGDDVGADPADVEAPRWLTVPGRLGLLALLLLGAGTWLVLLMWGAPEPRGPLDVPVVLLLVGMLVVELGRMHVEVRRSAVTVTLSDAAVVVALFTVPPDEVVLLRTLACAPVLLWLYRRSITKLAVNTGVLLLETAVMAGMVQLLTGRPDPVELTSWAAVLLAGQTSGFLCGIAVDAAIRLSGERLRRVEVVEGLLVGAVVSAVTAVFGLLAVTVLHSSSAGWVLIVFVHLLAMGAYRAYARMRERKDALEAVHAFTRSLDGEEDPDALMRAVLSEVPRLLSAERVVIVLLDDTSAATVVVEGDGESLHPSALAPVPPAVQRVLDTGAPSLIERRARADDDRRSLAQSGARELMVTPLSADGKVVGALVAFDRMGESRGFRAGDLVLFETLASHAGIALANAQLVSRLRRAADTDALTGLPNRHGLAAAVAALSGPAAVVVLDLNGFTEVNEALGHHAGDALLRATGRRIAEGVRAGTLVARLDGDEFAVLLPDVGRDEASEVAVRLLDLIAEAVELETVPVALDAAAGIATSDTAQDVVRAAEIALRATRGRGGMLVYEPGMDPPSADRLAIASELRRVLADPVLADQVLPFFQPKARLVDGQVHAVEALVRWQHPVRGLVPPDAFIPVIESTDLVRPLTLHVLDRSLRQAALWAAAGRPLVVAVNLSARNLLDHRLVDDVSALLARHGVAPSLLSLEITESAVMDDPERAQVVLQGLAGLGVDLSVDDFGTGYSSLAYLARLPVSEVKVDRAFVSRMTVEPRDAAVVRSVVDLGHSLGLRVVAEGVEEQDCYDALRDMGCDVAQGYLLSRPLPAAALELWLADRAPSISVREVLTVSPA